MTEIAMFGLLNIEKSLITDKHDRAEYQAHYCGLCHALGNEYNPFYRLITNYEVTLFYLILTSLKTENHGHVNVRCPVSFGKKNAHVSDDSAVMADLSVFLFHEKIKDDELDEKRKIPGFIRRRLERDALKACERLAHKGIDCDYIQELMDTQRDLEKKNVHALETISEPTALTMAHIFEYLAVTCNKADHKTSFRNVGYNLGQWIYIMDSIIDFEKDLIMKRFNPIALTCNTTSRNILIHEIPNTMKTDIRHRLFHILANLKALLPALHIGQNISIIRHIIIDELERKTNIVIKAMETPNRQSRQKLSVIQASFAGLMVPELAFASNGSDQSCGSLGGPILACGVLLYAFKTMFRCQPIACCFGHTHPDRVQVDTGCGQKRIYKKGCDGTYRDERSCC